MKTTQPINETVPFVWQSRGEQKGPSVSVLGGVHGDETVGIEVVNQLLLYFIMNEVKKGVLNCGYGNVDAMRAGKRFIEKDLNRCFGQSLIKKNREEARATMLERVLVATDFLLDVHSTMKPSKPFICVPHLDHPYASLLPLLGIPTIVTGEGLLPPDKTPIYTDTFVCAKGGTPHGSPHGGFGVTIETGWQQEKNRVAEIREGILRMIVAMGIFDETIQHPFLTSEIEKEQKSAIPLSENNCEYWDAYWNVIAENDFAFSKEWGNFDILSPGTHFATSGGERLVALERSIVLFPKPPQRIVKGQEACIIARAMKR